MRSFISGRLSGRLSRWLLVVGLACSASGVAWAASAAAPWALAERPGRLAPYTLERLPAGDAEQEIAFYRARSRNNPDGFLDLAMLAEAYVRRAKATGEASWYLLAEQAASKSIARFDAHPQAHLVLAQVAIARHDFAQALAICERIVRQHPEAAEVASPLATAHLALGHLSEARRLADALVRTSPGLASYTQRGLVLAAQGQDEAAAADFERAIGLEQPGQLEASALARAWLGRLHLENGRLEAAGDLLREARRLTPAHPVVLGLLGDLARREKREADASLLYAQAFDRSQNPAYLVAQARAEGALGNAETRESLWASAERRLRQDLAAGSFGHRRDLARLLLERDRPGEAAEALALMRSERRVREDAETLYVLAWSLEQTGHLKEAHAVMRQALAPGATHFEWQQRAERIERALDARMAAGDPPRREP